MVGMGTCVGADIVAHVLQASRTQSCKNRPQDQVPNTFQLYHCPYQWPETKAVHEQCATKRPEDVMIVHVNCIARTHVPPFPPGRLVTPMNGMLLEAEEGFCTGFSATPGLEPRTPGPLRPSRTNRPTPEKVFERC